MLSTGQSCFGTVILSKRVADAFRGDIGGNKEDQVHGLSEALYEILSRNKIKW